MASTNRQFNSKASSQERVIYRKNLATITQLLWRAGSSRTPRCLPQQNLRASFPRSDARAKQQHQWFSPPEPAALLKQLKPSAVQAVLRKENEIEIQGDHS